MRRIRTTIKRPKSPWDTQRIEAEKKLMAAYGLRRKKEIRVAEALLRNFRQRARELNAVRNEAEEQRLLGRLQKVGVLPAGAGLDQVLALTVKDVLERRLQTIVFRQGKALSARHARQVIVHELISIGGKIVKYPSYLVAAGEEDTITVAKLFTRPEPKKAEQAETTEEQETE